MEILDTKTFNLFIKLIDRYSLLLNIRSDSESIAHIFSCVRNLKEKGGVKFVGDISTSMEISDDLHVSSPTISFLGSDHNT